MIRQGVSWTEESGVNHWNMKRVLATNSGVLRMAFTVDAMIAGAEKAGTTSMGALVASHPQVLSHFGASRWTEGHRWELTPFGEDVPVKSEEFKERLVEFFGREPVEGEVAVGKFVRIMHEKKIAERLYQHNQACRIIVNLRNPVDRAYSSYWHQRWRGHEDAETFEEALQRECLRSERGEWAPHRMYIGKGVYIKHLRRLTELFGRDQVYVVLVKDLKDRPQEVLDRVFGFLGLDSHSIRSDERRNKSKRARSWLLARMLQKDGLIKQLVRGLLPKEIRRTILWGIRWLNTVPTSRPPMDENTRRTLLKHFEPYNKQLEKWLDRDLTHWYS